MKQKPNKANYCKINPILYGFFLKLRAKLGAQIVHRRKRKNPDSIEIIYAGPLVKELVHRLNTLKEAENCGYWIICRPQRGKHQYYRGHQVFQLFLSPVHPKKRNEAKYLAVPVEVSFEPIQTKKQSTIQRKRKVTTCVSSDYLSGRRVGEIRTHDLLLPKQAF